MSERKVEAFAIKSSANMRTPFFLVFNKCIIHGPLKVQRKYYNVVWYDLMHSVDS